MTKFKILSLALIACLVVFSSQAWAAQEWTQTFYKGTQGPEYRGPWVVAIERLSKDKGIEKGFITEVGYTWNQAGRSYGDDTVTPFWSVPSSMNISGLSMTNDIAAWLSPPSGATRSIMYAIKQDFSSGGNPNNSDIISIDENGVEVLLVHGSKRYEPPYDTLGLDDPWGDYDIGISDFDYKADLKPHRLYYDHYNAIYAAQSAPYYTYRGSPSEVSGQSDEDMYFSLGKVGKFDDKGVLLYGMRPFMMWGTTSGSGSAGAYGYPTFDRYGDFSGEVFRYDPARSNNRWMGSVEIGTTTYWFYLENTDGSIKNYNASKYPEDSSFPGDPDKASGYPFVWNDDYELQLTYAYSLGVTTYGNSGRWVMERTQIYYWNNIQAYPHEGDIMSEIRTYSPLRNDDGPKSPYEWLYDASGNMYEPLPGYSSRPDIADPELRRATELVAETMSWAFPIVSNTSTNTPPNTTSKWWCWNTNGTSLWRWRTYDGRGTGSNRHNHPVYQNDDNYGLDMSQNPTGINWLYNPTSLGAGGIPGVWYKVTELAPNLEAGIVDPKHNDYYVGMNINGGIVSRQFFEYAWKIAGKLLGDRFWESGLVWSNVLGAVATRELIRRDFLGGSCVLYLPNMKWDSVSQRWIFPTTHTYLDTSMQNVWGWYDRIKDTAAPGHTALNDFLKYVMDIDALVVQDTNGNGVYDETEDYILFSLVDDGRFTRMTQWGQYIPDLGGASTPFAGQYFSGETIFLYHDCQILTYFDPATGVFFGNPISTTLPSTLWAIPGFYDLNALDIMLYEEMVIPEPATMILIVGAGIALGAGIIRRKARR